jgi:hypothetical protein
MWCAGMTYELYLSSRLTYSNLYSGILVVLRIPKDMETAINTHAHRDLTCAYRVFFSQFNFATHIN